MDMIDPAIGQFQTRPASVIAAKSGHNEQQFN